MTTHFLTILLFLSLYSCNEDPKAKKKSKRPKTGKYGKICYPRYPIPPVFEIIQTRDFELLKECKDVKGTPLIFNTKEKNLSKLKGIKSVDGIDIKSNQELLSLEGLEDLEVVTANIVIRANPKLKDISALRNIKKIDGNVYIDSGFDNDPKKRQFIDKDHVAETFVNTSLGKLFYTYIEASKIITLECVKDIKHGWSCHQITRPKN